MASKAKQITLSSILPPILDIQVSPLGSKVEADSRALPGKGKGEKVTTTRSPKFKDAEPDQEAWRRQQKLIDQHHLAVYKNMHRLRNALYQRYGELLKDKIHSQRKEIKQRRESAEANSKTETKQTRRRLSYSKLSHDDAYLRSLPKTSYYLILDLQNQLARHGCLKTHQDFEDFSKSIKYNHCPHQLQRDLQDISKNMIGSKSTPHLYPQSLECPEITITAEHNQHVDQSHLSNGEPETNEESCVSPLSSSKQQQQQEEGDNTEQMFPKIKVPKFATLQPSFVRNLQTKMPTVKLPEVPKKSRRAENKLRKLQHMHTLSLTNMAISQRLLDRERHSLCMEEERSVQDWLREVKRASRPLLPLSPLRRPATPVQVESRVTTASPQLSETQPRSTAVAHSDMTPAPLTMEDACQQNPRGVIDQEPKMWSNYVGNMK